MHELSIARTILDMVASVETLEPEERYTTVRLRVGEVSGVEPEALSFSLEVLAAHRGWTGIDFRIERTAIRRRCDACLAEFTVGGMGTACPRCGDPRTMLTGGDELEVISVDVEGP